MIRVMRAQILNVLMSMAALVALACRQAVSMPSWQTAILWMPRLTAWLLPMATVLKLKLIWVRLPTILISMSIMSLRLKLSPTDITAVRFPVILAIR